MNHRTEFMTDMFSFRSTTPIHAWLTLLAACLLINSAQAQSISVTAQVEPQRIAPNQIAMYSLVIENAQIAGVPELSFPAPLTVVGQIRTSQSIQIINGATSIVTTLQWPITCEQEGSFTIPAQTVELGTQSYTTDPVAVEVKAGAQGMKPDGVADGQDNGLGEMEPILQLTMKKTEFYQGEIVPIEATLYIPRTERIQLRRLGLIEVEKSDLAVQRFPQQSDQSLETVGGIRYIALKFVSSVSALKPGKIKVGPAKMELVLDIASGGGRNNFPFGFMQMEQRKVVVQAGAIPITVLAMPAEGKPASFSGAVGDFTISSSLNESTVTVGDPLAVDVMIEGQGNFDAIEAPKLSPSAGWKVYPPKRYNVDTGDPNTADLINRKLGFNQIIVPEKVTNEVPSFEFSFFSPATKKYVTLRSEPLPVTIRPSANPTVAAPVATGSSTPAASPANPAPEADITDILMPIAATPRWAVASTPLLSDRRYLVVNAVLLAVLVGFLVWTLIQRTSQRRTLSDKQRLRQLLAEVERSNLNEKEFYRHAAAYVKAVAGNQPTAEALAVLERYETVNFTPGRPVSESVPAEERARVLAILKQLKPTSITPPALPTKAVMGLLLALMTVSVMASPQEQYAALKQSLEKGDFATAEKTGLAMVAEGHVSADVFTLLGHASYKQGKPGIAAMWYERARLFPSSAPELSQNLRHIGEKIHCFVRDRNEWLERLGLALSRNAWVLLGTGGAWLVLIGAGLLIVVRSSGVRWLALAAMPSGLLLLVLAGLGWQARPSFDDLHSLAFVVAPKALAHTAATKVSGTVIPVPQGSVVQKIEERGQWAYVLIPQPGEDLRGWLPSSELEAFWPYDAAKLP